MKLTKQESRVKRAQFITLKMQGVPQKEIAKKLEISEQTLCAWNKTPVMSKKERLHWLNLRLDGLISANGSVNEIKGVLSLINSIK